MNKCTDCTRCPYEYCINEEKEPVEKPDRTEYFEEYQKINKEKIYAAHREAYKEKKENGICVRCAKKATHGLYCRDHYIAEKRKSADRSQIRKNQRQEKGLINEYRRQQGLCLWCGEKATGGTCACDKHRAIFAQASQKSMGREYWARLKKLRIEEIKNAKDGRI